jgi:hypothetical protein
VVDSRGCDVVVGFAAMSMACGPLVVIPSSTKQDDSWYEGVEDLTIGCVFFWHQIGCSHFPTSCI